MEKGHIRKNKKMYITNSLNIREKENISKLVVLCKYTFYQFY